MRGLIVASSLLLTFAVTPAHAGRPLTDQEKTKLEAALAAQGCSGGKSEFDDGLFEVDDALCGDSRKYDLKFDASFKLVKKKLEH